MQICMLYVYCVRSFYLHVISILIHANFVLYPHIHIAGNEELITKTGKYVRIETIFNRRGMFYFCFVAKACEM